jgi:hypothetical protein
LGDCISLVVKQCNSKKVPFGFGDDDAPDSCPNWGLRAGDPYTVSLCGATLSGTVTFG